ncbi:MAG: hypothetical protein IPJ94_29110 [Chloroflexi bacterium]|nr:hypothetical protein [Chloroflexota bacterium]
MKEYVSDLYHKIKGESSGLGNLLAKVPGLGGYMERGRRREADQILRDTISGHLEASRLTLSSVHQELGRDIIKAMDFAEPLGRADNMLMGLIGKIKDAPQGYAGFFDAVKVKEDDLARLYAFDESMLNHVDEVDASIEALQTAVRDDGDINSTIRRLTTVLQTANQDFANRNEVLMGIN